MTKGEAILQGLDQIREGLELIRKAGSQADALRVLVGSQKGAEQLRAVMNPGLLRTLVVSMVQARVRRVSPATVEQVLDEFFKVLFDLAKPHEIEPRPAAPAASQPGAVAQR